MCRRLWQGPSICICDLCRGWDPPIRNGPAPPPWSLGQSEGLARLRAARTAMGHRHRCRWVTGHAKWLNHKETTEMTDL